jgi:hypothetical protein
MEMRMKPICAIAAGRRARASAKCFGLKTWVNQLVKKPLQIRKWTWVSARQFGHAIAETQRKMVCPPTLTPKTVKNRSREQQQAQPISTKCSCCI